MPKPKNTSLNLTATEREVVILKAALDLINDMVNHQIFELLGENPNKNILFHTENHQRLFSIFLADFLSETDKRIIGSEKTYLEFLDTVLKNPSFESNGSDKALRAAIENFSQWLGTEITFEKVWFPSLNNEISLVLTRGEFLKICGIISKHNFSRLSSIRNKICILLNKNGFKATPEKALLAINDFYDHFYSDILNYHGSALAEMLNEIRWGIQDYLKEEYSRHEAMLAKTSLGKTYEFPNSLRNEFAKFCYLELMFQVGIGPYFRRFKITKHLKLRY